MKYGCELLDGHLQRCFMAEPPALVRVPTMHWEQQPEAYGRAGNLSSSSFHPAQRLLYKANNQTPGALRSLHPTTAGKHRHVWRLFMRAVISYHHYEFSSAWVTHEDVQYNTDEPSRILLTLCLLILDVLDFLLDQIENIVNFVALTVLINT